MCNRGVVFPGCARRTVGFRPYLLEPETEPDMELIVFVIFGIAILAILILHYVLVRDGFEIRDNGFKMIMTSKRKKE